MAQQTIGLGSAPNDGTGDDLRTAGDKINDNFSELYALKAPLVSPDFTGAGPDIITLTDSSATGYSGIKFAGTGAKAFNLIMGGPSESFFGVADKFAIYDPNASAVRVVVDGNGNFGLRTANQFGSGQGVVGIANAAVVPGANPTGGGVLYVEGGALKYRGSGGTVTTIAPA